MDVAATLKFLVVSATRLLVPIAWQSTGTTFHDSANRAFVSFEPPVAWVCNVSDAVALCDPPPMYLRLARGEAKKWPTMMMRLWYRVGCRLSKGFGSVVFFFSWTD